MHSLSPVFITMQYFYKFIEIFHNLQSDNSINGSVTVFKVAGLWQYKICVLFIGTVRIVGDARSTKRSGVCPPVCLSHRLTAAAVAGRVCCWAPYRQPPAPRTSCRRAQQHRRRRSTVHAGSVMLSAAERGWTEIYLFIYLLSVYFFYLSTYYLSTPSVLWRCWLGGRKGNRPAKNWVVGCWRGYLSGARCRLAYGPADASATQCLLLQ